MQIDSIHFYVENANRLRDWSISQLGLHVLVEDCAADGITTTHHVGNERLCLIISSPLTATSPVADYLRERPPGVHDIAFRVRSLDEMKQKLDRLKIEILAISSVRDRLQWLKIRGWGAMEHTIVQEPAATVPSRSAINLSANRYSSPAGFDPPTATITEIDRLGLNVAAGELDPAVATITEIDHLVLNVAAGELDLAVAWYRDLFDFRVQQSFDIHTQTSGLASKALVSACGQIRFNINEPSSPNSQIQAFLDVNRGAGIQHIALHTNNILTTVDRMQQQGLAFLPIPATYYTNLKMRSERELAARLTSDEAQTLERLGILADWQEQAPEALLMQIFTQPIFGEPTFFFEIIERRNRATGFGQGNFQALFEAVELANERD